MDSINIDPCERFAQCYNRVSFPFRHNLHEHELFELHNLLELAQRQGQSPAFAHWSNGTVNVNDRWESGSGLRYSLRQTIRDIAVNNSLAVLKHVEQDRIFGPLVHAIQERVLELAGARMRGDAISGRGTLLIASPGRITSYHIDSDVNFLFQIRGDKLFCVFDPDDRSILPHEELENYFLGDANGAIFKPDREPDAKSYDLGAGCGVHVPCMSGHWAKNLDSPSVALSINWDLRSVTSTGRVYRFNGRLRRLGLNPVPPGVSHWRDNVKTTALELLQQAARLKGGA